MTIKTKEITKDTRAIHLEDGSVYTVGMSHKTDESWASQYFASQSSWESDPAIVMGKKIVPYGHNNDLPSVIRKIMDNSNIGPGILERKIGLQYGEGPFLYKEEIVEIDGKNYIFRQPTDSPIVKKWLDSWDWQRYIDVVTTEVIYLKGHFTRTYRNRASRLTAEERSILSAQGIDSSDKILKLEAVLSTWARLGWPEHPEKNLANVKEIYVGDFENNCLHSGIATFPVFDIREPFKHRVSMSYHNIYSFGRNFYSVPSYYGTLKWLTTASDIPDIINYLTENGISAAYHIHSPQRYWDDKRQKLMEKYPNEADPQIDRRLQELKDQLFGDIVRTLTGKANAGKFIQSVDFYDMDGNFCEWKVEPIDQKIKDFIEAQIKVSEKADSAATSGMGLNPALANLVTNNSFSGGSQQLYAEKFHVRTDVNIPERIIFEAINQAIAINFPEEEVKMGFYRKEILKESDVAPKDRVINQN